MALTDDEFPSIFDSATRVLRGLCPVSDVRNPLSSHSLYYEQHGNGPEKILFIMGLNSSCFAWSYQIEYFSRLPNYTSLVFDNRGAGYSGTPRGPYTTSAMAEDAIALLDFLGWTAPRDFHVVSISLGGMIAQELATRIPDRIISLTLGVTTAGGSPWTNLPPWKGFLSLTRLTFMTDLATKIPLILETAFPSEWLDQKADDDPAARTNRAIQTEVYLRRNAMARPQTLLGSLSQMAAAFTHYVSPSRLFTLSSSIPRILIVTGDKDNLVNSKHSWYLKEHIPGAEFVVFPRTGHVIHIQRKDRFHEVLMRNFREGKEKVIKERTD